MVARNTTKMSQTIPLQKKVYFRYHFEGIVHQITNFYTLQQNRLSEMVNRTAMESARLWSSWRLGVLLLTQL